MPPGGPIVQRQQQLGAMHEPPGLPVLDAIEYSYADMLNVLLRLPDWLTRRQSSSREFCRAHAPKHDRHTSSQKPIATDGGGACLALWDGRVVVLQISDATKDHMSNCMHCSARSTPAA